MVEYELSAWVRDANDPKAFWEYIRHRVWAPEDKDWNLDTFCEVFEVPEGRWHIVHVLVVRVNAWTEKMAPIGRWL